MSRILTKKIYIITIVAVVVYFISVLLFLVTQTDLALTVWELVTILSGPVILLVMLQLGNDLNRSKTVIYAMLSFMTSVCILTSAAHIVNISVTRKLISEGVDVPSYFQIGQWPSVEMAVDYLAWGFFMGLAFLSLSLPPLKSEEKKNCLRFALMICGFMCLIGFFGAIFINENLWYIAPMAYGPGIIIICILAMFAGKNK